VVDDLVVTTPDQWDFSDAWVFAAIRTASTGSGNSASLAEMVAAADAINHAILLDSEVQNAVQCLLGAGLICIDGRRRFRLTGSGEDIGARHRGGLIGQVSVVLSALQRVERRSVSWSLQPDEMNAAIAEYKRILKFNPNYPFARFHLAQAHERKGQRDRFRHDPSCSVTYQSTASLY